MPTRIQAKSANGASKVPTVQVFGAPPPLQDRARERLAAANESRRRYESASARMDVTTRNVDLLRDRVRAAKIAVSHADILARAYGEIADTGTAEDDARAAEARAAVLAKIEAHNDAKMQLRVAKKQLLNASLEFAAAGDALKADESKPRQGKR